MRYTAITAFGSLLSAFGSALAGPPAPEPSKPSFELRLSRDEFTVLHAAAESGVGRYGGSADFKLSIGKWGDQQHWTITTDDTKLMEVWGFWLDQKSAEVLDRVDFDRLDDPSKATLRVLQASRAKLASATKSPRWEVLTFDGVVQERDGHLVLDGETHFRIAAASASALKPWLGRRIVVTGYHKSKGELEALRAVELRADTLELCVMSQCPFGKRAEAAIIKRLREPLSPGASLADGPRLRLEVRYIFLKGLKDDKPAYFSMHGETEITENLVQMAIRDSFPESQFHDYLLHRAESDAPWKEIAGLAGMNLDAIGFVETTIARDRDAMIEREYAYVAESCGVLDKSPTLIWEGRRVADLRPVKALSDIDLSGGACNSAPSQH